MTTTIGIDPGYGPGGGAAAILSGRLPFVLGWRRIGSGPRYHLRNIQPEGITEEVTDDLLAWLYDWLPLEADGAAVESVAYHAGKGGQLAERADHAGTLAGLVMGRTGCRVLRPTPAQWWRSVLGLDQKSNVDRYAVAFTRGRTPFEWKGPPIDFGIDWTADVVPTSHEADAVCLAVLARQG